MSAIRQGVKSERETMPMQVRMFKDQIRLLKAASFIEGRTQADILRTVLAEYFDKKANSSSADERTKWKLAQEIAGATE